MKYILAVMDDWLETHEVFDSEDELTEKLACTLAELVADGADFQDAFDDFTVFRKMSLGKEFMETVRKEVDLEVPLVLKKQRDEAFEEVDRLIEIAKSA